MARRVLVVDDEKAIVKGLKFSLEQDDMEVTCAYDGQEALDLVKAQKFDIILLDVMLPKLTGFEVCQAIREFSNIPIMMLTAKDDDMDKIMGLEYGADDYITKPFNVIEVKARIKAIMRRVTAHNEAQRRDDSPVIESGELVIDTEAHKLTIGEKNINLTTKEFDMLMLFVSNPGRIYSRDALLAEIWGQDYPGDARTVDVHIRRLRSKMEANPSEPTHVLTKWGVGYYYQQVG